MPTAADNASSKDSSASFGSAGLSGKSSSKSSHRKRARATSEQVSVLESVFLVNRSPASRLREDLATRLGMAPRQVQVWFQNRRAKEKTQQRNPRALQHHQSMIIDPLAYANTSPDFYSMAMASSFIAGGGSTDPGSATPANGNSGFGASPAAMSFGAGPSGIGYPSAMQSQHQSQQQHSSLIDNHMAFAAAASINAGGNPWMNWSADMAQQDPNSSSSPSQYFPFANPPSLASPGALMSNGQFNGLPMGGAGQFSSDALYMAASAGKMEGYSASNGSGASAITGSAGATTTTASSVAAALMYAANIGDSRRESEMSGMTAVASPTGPESVTMASDATATSVSSAVSPVTTPVAAAAGAATDTCMAAITTTAASHAPATISSDTLRCVSSGASSSQLMLNMGMSVPGVSAGIATAGSDSSGNFNNVMEASAAAAAVAGESSGHATPVSGSRMAGSLRRPAPLALVAHHGSMHPGQAPQFGSSSGMSMAMGGRPGMGYSSLIPEIASFMVLDATRLTVGSWHRVPMSDTELTCLACVEPPPLKPVQRPGNHRPAELDSLVGEFQWIISSCNVRYKMVLPYSAISRIKFRESPDPAVQLVDTVSETVINPQAAMSLLNCALKNPQAKGELSIHVYDLPSYYFQSEGGEWVKIGDFSENLSASNTYVHTVSGSFVTLFCQLRILLATCSRLKIAADPLMSLWLGNMDDPYSAITGIPHNTWLPCSEAVRLHSVNRGNTSDQIVSAETAVSGGDMGDDHSGITSPSHQSSASGSAAMVAGALPAFNMYIPVSAATSSTIGTLTPTPTSMTGTNINHLPMNVMPPALAATRHSVFAFHDSGHPAALAAAAAASAFNNNLAAAMAGGVGQLPLKTQRSASLPFIRSAASINGSGAGKVNPSSSLCRTIDGDSLGPNEASDQEDDDEKSNYQSHQQHSGGSSTPTTSAGMGATTNTSPPQLPQPAAPLPLRQRTSCNHLRRAAPYPVAPYQGTPVAGSSRVNSPQMSPSPYWYAQNLRRASRDSLS
ncbi:Short stature homeobox protein 2, partial [Kickxella alabastrina]